MQQATSLSLPAVLNASTAVAAQTSLRQHIDAQAAQTEVVLDAAALTAFDSAGLALLLALRRHALAQGRNLRVQSWPTGLLALAKVYGVLPLLDPSAVDAAPALA